ncbi:MAG TPA: hypothetical protein VFJ51_03985 [Nitrososphaeraceae archaeon]|nr:hypothetical protein [Nitrososphaeraceae archaeon]
MEIPKIILSTGCTRCGSRIWDGFVAIGRRRMDWTQSYVYSKLARVTVTSWLLKPELPH